MNERIKLQEMSITERIGYIAIMICISFIGYYIINLLLFFPIERLASFKEALPVATGLAIGLLLYYILLQLKNNIVKKVSIVTLLLLGYIGLCMPVSHNTLAIIISCAGFFYPIRILFSKISHYICGEEENADDDEEEEEEGD